MLLTIKFACGIYQEHAIKQAIRDFASLTKTRVVKKDGYFAVSFVGKKGVTALADEFANYALGLTKKLSSCA